jgi:hypothetical protein
MHRESRASGYAVGHDGSLLHAVAPLAALPDCPIGKGEWQAGLDVYRALADAGGAHQRAVKHADLLIAAAGRTPRDALTCRPHARDVGATMAAPHVPSGTPV